MSIVEVMTANPKVSIAAFSVVVTFISTLVQKKFTDQEHLKSLKARQKEIQVEIKKAKEPSVMQELNAEMLQLTGVMFKSSMKPMFVTIIPFLILFTWLRSIYVPVMGNGWIWYYLGYSILASIVLRKVLKVA
ncbi:MAG: EMC3/TMCO1 family protein [archaeon]